MQRINYIVVFMALWLLCACGRQGPGRYEVSSASEAQQALAAEEGRHSLDKTVGAVQMKLRYIPAEEMALRGLRDVRVVSQAAYDSLVAAYQATVLFKLEVSVDGFSEELVHYRPGTAAATTDFETLSSYYAFGMQKDLYVLQGGKDTLRCQMYHYERNYGISPRNTFLLGFAPANLKDGILVYDNPYLTTGPVKFALNELDLNTHPQIKINAYE